MNWTTGRITLPAPARLDCRPPRYDDVAIETLDPPAPVTSTAAALVASARQGDRQAFARLHEEFASTVHGLLLARAPREEAEDLVQEVFLKAWEALPSLRDPERFPGWLATIARNAARDHRRRRMDAVPLPADLSSEDAGTVEAEEVLAAIRELPEAYREPLVLRLVEGLSGPEIAARTGMTPGSVRVNLCRGMGKLRERLSEIGWP